MENEEMSTTQNQPEIIDLTQDEEITGDIQYEEDGIDPDPSVVYGVQERLSYETGEAWHVYWDKHRQHLVHVMLSEVQLHF